MKKKNKKNPTMAEDQLFEGIVGCLKRLAEENKKMKQYLLMFNSIIKKEIKR